MAHIPRHVANLTEIMALFGGMIWQFFALMVMLSIMRYLGVVTLHKKAVNVFIQSQTLIIFASITTLKLRALPQPQVVPRMHNNKSIWWWVIMQFSIGKLFWEENINSVNYIIRIQREIEFKCHDILYSHEGSLFSLLPSYKMNTRLK